MNIQLDRKMKRNDPKMIKTITESNFFNPSSSTIPPSNVDCGSITPVYPCFSMCTRKQSWVAQTDVSGNGFWCSSHHSKLSEKLDRKEDELIMRYSIGKNQMSPIVSKYLRKM